MTGATLIELLVAIAIVAFLSGMLMPMLALAERTAKRTRSEAILRKVDAALRQFHAELGVYPYQDAYPDLAHGESLATHPNRLGYHLGVDISDDDRRRVLADMDAAAGSFADDDPRSALRFTDADTISPNRGILVNRMARQRARLAVLAGDTAPAGPCFTAWGSRAITDRSGQTALGRSASADHAGWASDYLHGQLERRCIDPRTLAIRDDYGTPLAYISQNVPGVTGSCDIINEEQIHPFDSRAFGLGPQGFAPGSGPWAGLLRQGRQLLLYSGRIRLSGTDAGDGQPTPADPDYLPDPANPMRSDARYYAAPGYENEFELWSAGPDRRFAWMRDDPANRDNLAITPYLSALR